MACPVRDLRVITGLLREGVLRGARSCRLTHTWRTLTIASPTEHFKRLIRKKVKVRSDEYGAEHTDCDTAPDNFMVDESVIRTVCLGSLAWCPPNLLGTKH